MTIDTNKFLHYKKITEERIKYLRESKGYSLNDLPSRCDLEKTSISRIEDGRTNITFKTALILLYCLRNRIKGTFRH